MPRKARVKSESGMYHILIRGMNHQSIFEDDEDCEEFIKKLGKYKIETDSKVFAYCLMKNHIHLLIKVEGEKLTSFMRKLSMTYVYWFNWKYHRTGGLFQDRYLSEVVEDDSYFLKVLRFIHQNPIKSGFCNQVDEYVYSSYNAYNGINANHLVDTEFALSIIEKDQFVLFNNEQNNDTCLELRDVTRLYDSEAKKIIYKISKCQTVEEFKALETPNRDKFIKKFKEKGLSIRQIERLTGVSRGIVQRLS